ncbi:MAG: carbohydrate-binding family 9-like protein [Sediminicola sp.]
MDVRETNDSIYRVKKSKKAIQVNGDWNKDSWKSVKPILLTHYMGKIPEFQPTVHAKMSYDKDYLYLIFRVEDRNFSSNVQEYNGPVSNDACVEFFFSPNGNRPNEYFNIEVNAGGTPLAGYHSFKKDSGALFSEEDFKTIQIAHSMPKVIAEEIKEPTTWTVEYKVPFSTLEKYTTIKRPVPGDIWKANFYKIAGEGSNPHYLTWSFVDYPRPNFHLPQFFGKIEFTH